jgi:hypothetical protein
MSNERRGQNHNIGLSRAKRLVFTMIVAFGVLIFAMMVELILQAAYYRSSKGEFLFRRAIEAIYEPDPIRGHRVKPNLAYRRVTNEFDTWVYTNSKGMRSSAQHEDHPYEKRAGTTRVLFLGPSFVFGTGGNYEDIYQTLLVSMLRGDGYNVEGVNAGTPSQGILAQLKWCLADCYQYKPDIVVQTVYGTLFTGDEVPAVSTPGLRQRIEEFDPPLIVEDGYLVPKNATVQQRAIAQLKKSGIIFYGFHLKNVLVNAVAGNSNTKIEGAGRQIVRVPKLDENSPIVAAAVQEYRDLVSVLREAFGSDVRIVFVVFPLGYVVHREDAPRWAHLGVRDVQVDVGNAALIAEAIRKSGIDLVDATEELLERGRTARMYNYIDIHFTKAGNQAVAGVLYGYFTKHNVMAPGAP